MKTDETKQAHATYETQVRLVSDTYHAKSTRQAHKVANKGREKGVCFAAPLISWPLTLARLRRSFAHAGRHTAVSRVSQQLAEHVLPQPSPDAQSEAMLDKAPAPVDARPGRPSSKARERAAVDHLLDTSGTAGT